MDYLHSIQHCGLIQDCLHLDNMSSNPKEVDTKMDHPESREIHNYYIIFG